MRETLTSHAPAPAVTRGGKVLAWLPQLLAGKWTRAILAWLPFVAILAWRWGARNFFRTIPYYGDVLEVTWGISWFADALRLQHGFLFYPLIFFPQGWQVATFGQALGPGLFVLTAPLYWLGGAAFAYNASVLLTFVAVYAGSLKLARCFVTWQAAVVVALLSAFWSVRWFSLIGHLNILVGTAALPWALWGIERGLSSLRRWAAWLVFAGACWGLAISGTAYFVWIGGIALGLWLLGRLLAGRAGWRQALLGLLLCGFTALALNAPGFFLLWQASALSGAGFYGPQEVNFWGASLNSLFLPFLQHPWLGSFALSLYRGVPFEQAQVNLGLFASLAALLAVPAAWKRPAWRPALFLTAAGVLLALGLTLKWDNQSIRLAALQPLDAALWRLMHALKPSFFSPSQPPTPFDASIALPGMVLAGVVPFFERARVFARYAVIGSVGIFLLAGLALDRLPNRWLRLGLGAALVFEILPPPLPAQPYPPPIHPAFTWLRQQSMPGQGIVDLEAATAKTLELSIDGETLVATGYHRQATVSGASSVWPAHTRYLMAWLAGHDHPLADPDFAQLLRFYRVRYVLLHMHGANERAQLAGSASDPELRKVGCFPPPAGPSPWSYPICVLEVMPPAHPGVNLILEDGWSSQEAWGVWAEGSTSRAMWVATEASPSLLSASAFPQCVPGRAQRLEITVNGQLLGSHQWQGCEPWSADVPVPTSVVQVGENQVVFQAAYAESPAELSKGANADARPLSIGFSELLVTPGHRG